MGEYTHWLTSCRKLESAVADSGVCVLRDSMCSRAWLRLTASLTRWFSSWGRHQNKMVIRYAIFNTNIHKNSFIPRTITNNCGRHTSTYSQLVSDYLLVSRKEKEKQVTRDPDKMTIRNSDFSGNGGKSLLH